MCTEQNQAFGGGVRAHFVDFVDITGVHTGGAYTDNQGIVFSTDGEGHRFIRGSYTSNLVGTFDNRSLIWLDRAWNVAIIGVLLEQSSNPIQFKHAHSDSAATPFGTIQNCIFRLGGNGPGSAGGRGAWAQANYQTWINNAFDKCNLIFDGDDGSTPVGGRNCVIRHNTFFDSLALSPNGEASATTASNCTARDNVVLGTSLWMDYPYHAGNKNNSLNYSAVEGAATNRYRRNSGIYTQSGYTTAFPDQEVNGVAGTLTLVGGATPGSTPANWALAAGSVGIGNASDSGDRGVRASRLRTLEGWTP